MISRSFIKGSLLYTVAGALPMASALILLPLYIAYLPSSLYGVLSVCLAFSILVQILVTYSFDTSLYIHYHELKDDRPRLSAFISSSFLFMLLLGGVVMIIFSFAGEVVFRLFPSQPITFFPFGMIAVGLGIGQAVFKVHSNLLQTREDPVTYVWGNVAYFGLIAATTVVGLKLYPNSLIGPLGGRLLSVSLMLVWVFLRVFRQYGIHIINPWRIVSFGFNFYAFLYQLQQWTINYFDRFLMVFYLHLSQVGIYNFAVNCLVGIDLLLNGLHGTIYPRIIKRLNAVEDRKSSVEVNRYYYGLISVVLILICLSIFFIPIAINLFISESKYAEALQYLPYLAVVYIFRAMRLYFAVPYNVYKYMRELTTINFVASLIKVFLLLMLIKLYGVFGVIISAYVASLVEIILLWYFLRHKYEMNFNALKLIWLPLGLLVLVLVTEPFVSGTSATLAHLGYGVFCGVMMLVAYRNEMNLLTKLTA